MKRKIEQLVNGIFEYETPALVLSPEELTVSVTSGKTSRGTFAVESADGRKIRGTIYSSVPRVLAEPSEFYGGRCEIHFQVDGTGFPEGGEERGCFTICSELGEYTLPFTLRAREQEPGKKEEPQLLIGRADQLGPLAREDYQKAYRCFIRKDFRALLVEQEPDLIGLYDSLSYPSFGYQSLEEFLTGTRQKETVQISLDRRQILLENLVEPVAEVVELSRSTWGFCRIGITSDAGFLRPEKQLITTDEFAGSTFGLTIVIDTKMLHAGRNYGRVEFQTPYQKLTVEVTASGVAAREKDDRGRIRREMQKKLEHLYVRFRLQKLDLKTWTDGSVKAITNYLREGGTDPFAELFLIQLYYADGKRQKAIRLLEEMEKRPEVLDTPDRYGFYLYMTTFFYQETAYVDQVEEHIRMMLREDPANWRLQWVLLYLQESLLNDDSAKYEAVSNQFRLGCRSRLMYLEAYQAVRDNPFLLRHLGSFELQVLRFAAKEKVLTPEILRQTETLACHYGKYSRLLFEILTAGYQTSPSDELVRAICLLLMRGERRDEEAFYWYEKGVARGLKITGLYEYYMEATGCVDLQEMPQIIRMYFAYDTSLDYRKRAAIYECIAGRRESDPQTWRTYRPEIEKFVMDQLEMGRITEPLAALYESFLQRKKLTRQMAEQLSRILFTYEIACESPKIRSVTVHSARLVREQSAVFSHGKARIAIYDPESALVVENEQGERFAADLLCEKTRLFENDRMLEWCAELAPEFPGLLLYLCLSCQKEHIVNERTLPWFRKGCECEEFAPQFRDSLRQEVLNYYIGHPRDESLAEFLEQIAYPDYVKVDKASLITLLAEEGMCSDAFSLLDMYGAEQIPLVQLVRICSRMVLELEFAENAMLVFLCHFCFASGKYDDKLLRYLLLYFEGAIQEMLQVWEAARAFDLDTMLLEEKLLTMILFTKSGTQGSEPVFEAYVKKMGRKKLCRAYMNLKAYEYFVRGLPVADCVFQYIEKDYRQLRKQGRLGEQEEVCRLALLLRYSRMAPLADRQRQYAARMLEEFSTKGMRFAFWQRFDRELLRPYQMDGKVFVEYVADPQHSVTIFYRPKDSGEEYRKESVKNCFEGIFVREFTLFYGEELECYLEEDDGSTVRKTGLRTLTPQVQITDGVTQYELLNRLSKAVQEGDDAAADRELDNYLMLRYLADKVFTLV